MTRTTARLATYQEVLAVHAEGSIEAEKQMMLRSYDGSGALAYVERMAGLAAEQTAAASR